VFAHPEQPDIERLAEWLRGRERGGIVIDGGRPPRRILPEDAREPLRFEPPETPVDIR